jgi:predicted dithiol-disulfide oxidoreductase (DUF899 family)
MKTIETAITGHKVVSREEWLKERVALLEREKAHTRERDEINRNGGSSRGSESRRSMSSTHQRAR